MLVAEAWVARRAAAAYLRPDEYHQAFNFDLLERGWNADQSATTVTRSPCDAAASRRIVPTWVLSNHDVMRHATRYGLPSDVTWRRWPLDGPTTCWTRPRAAPRPRRRAHLLLPSRGRPTSTRARNSGLPEVWDLARRRARRPAVDRVEHTPSRAATAAGCPSRGPPTAPSFGFGAGPSRGYPSPPYSAISLPRARRTTRPRRSTSTARPCGSAESTSPPTTGSSGENRPMPSSPSSGPTACAASSTRGPTRSTSHRAGSCW